jgi:molybdopterin converting factor small subunit
MPTVELTTALRALTDGDRAVACSATTVRDALIELEERYPAMRGWVLDEQRALRRHISLFVNGEPGDIDDRLGADDRLVVLPAITGGTR